MCVCVCVLFVILLLLLFYFRYTGGGRLWPSYTFLIVCLCAVCHSIFVVLFIDAVVQASTIFDIQVEVASGLGTRAARL